MYIYRGRRPLLPSTTEVSIDNEPSYFPTQALPGEILHCIPGMDKGTMDVGAAHDEIKPTVLEQNAHSVPTGHLDQDREVSPTGRSIVLPR